MKPAKPKLVKIRNRRSVLELFRNSGTLTAAAISDELKISKTTVMKILDYLLRYGIIISSGKGESTTEGGKRPEVFKFNETFSFAVGVHVFPEDLLSIITDLNGNILFSIRTPLERDEEVESVVEKVCISCRSLLEATNIEDNKLIGIGIGIPGITDFKDGIVRMSPWFPSWGVDMDFRDIVRQKLGLEIPVMIDNECRFQAFAEKLRGVAQHKKNIIAVKAGEGLAAGIIVNDEIKRGIHHLAGEIGHMIINPHEKERCVCGSRGCFEASVYESRLIKKAIASRDQFTNSQIFEDATPGFPTSERIFMSANQGDELAVRLMDEIIKWFSIAFSNLIVMYDPEIIVIQGIYTKAGSYFIENLRKRVNSLVLSRIEKDVEIKYSELGPEIGALGAALFVISEYFQHDLKDNPRTMPLKASIRSRK